MLRSYLHDQQHGTETQTNNTQPHPTAEAGHAPITASARTGLASAPVAREAAE